MNIICMVVVIECTIRIIYLSRWHADEHNQTTVAKHSVLLVHGQVKKSRVRHHRARRARAFGGSLLGRFETDMCLRCFRWSERKNYGRAGRALKRELKTMIVASDRQY
jgi:hypothetical protein